MEKTKKRGGIMRHHLPFEIPEAHFNEAIANLMPSWKQHCNGWSPSNNIPLGIYAIDSWYNQTAHLEPLLDLINTEAQKTENPVEQSLYGFTIMLKAAFEELFSLIEFAEISFPYDPVVRRVGQNTDLNGATPSKNGEGEGDSTPEQPDPVSV